MSRSTIYNGRGSKRKRYVTADPMFYPKDDADVTIRCLDGNTVAVHGRILQTRGFIYHGYVFDNKVTAARFFGYIYSLVPPTELSHIIEIIDIIQKTGNKSVNSLTTPLINAMVRVCTDRSKIQSLEQHFTSIPSFAKDILYESISKWYRETPTDAVISRLHAMIPPINSERKELPSTSSSTNVIPEDIPPPTYSPVSSSVTTLTKLRSVEAPPLSPILEAATLWESKGIMPSSFDMMLAVYQNPSCSARYKEAMMAYCSKRDNWKSILPYMKFVPPVIRDNILSSMMKWTAAIREERMAHRTLFNMLSEADRDIITKKIATPSQPRP